MQLSLCTSIITVFLLASILPTRSNIEKKASVSSDSCQMSRKYRGVSQPRSDRETFEKAFLSNYKNSGAQRLAEKMAASALKSPEIQDTIQKLSTIRPGRSDRENSTTKIFPTGLETRKNRSCKFLRLKTPRKKTKKRRRREENSRFARQVASPVKKLRPDESLGLRNVDPMENPYEGLRTGINYPGVDDFESGENFLNDEPNNSMEDPVDPETSNSDENTQDFALNKYSDDFDDKIDNPNYYNTGDLKNVDLGYEDRKGPTGGKLFSSFHLPESQKRNNLNFRLPHGRTSDFSNYGHFGSSKHFGRRGFSSNAKRRAHSVHPVVAHVKRNVSKSQKKSETSTKAGNITENTSTTVLVSNATRLLKIDKKTPANVSTTFSPDSSTISLTSSTNSTTNVSAVTETTPRLKKSLKVEKSVFGNTENGTSTETSPKLKGISETSTVPFESSDRTEKLPTSSDKRLERRNNASITNETKLVAGQILNTIIEELQELKNDRSENSFGEGLPCKLSGSWITTIAGVRLDVLVTNHTVNISMSRLDFPVGIFHEALLNYTWNITGYAPFRRGGPFSFVATDDHTKSLAVFVGACKVCQGVDTIEGVWSLTREPRDCRDFQISTSVHNDIFRRTQLKPKR